MERSSRTLSVTSKIKGPKLLVASVQNSDKFKPGDRIVGKESPFVK